MNVVAAAENAVEATGVTDPNLIEAAVIDLLTTGDPNSVFASLNVQQQGTPLTGLSVSSPLPLPSVGILADTGPNGDISLESTTAPLAVTYTVYLTAAEAQATAIDYAVTTPGANYFDASALVAGTGSGSVTIAAGQTSAQITVDVLANALGSLPEADLQVSVTPTGGEGVYGGSAQVEIVNPTATAGTPAQVLLAKLTGDGTLTGGGTSYTLNLGTTVVGGAALSANLEVLNSAAGPADNLFGGFDISDVGALIASESVSAFANTGFDSFGELAAGAADVAPVISLDTSAIGTFSETIVLDPWDANDSGYSVPLSAVTLTAEGDVVACYVAGTSIRTESGEVPVEKLEIGDKVMTKSGAARPIKWIGRRSYGGRFVMGRKDILPVCIKAGALDDNVPRRDLWISPHHAMFLDDVLIEAKDLVNGVSIVQAERVEKVEYFRIELDSHDVIIAEGASSETFIDDDSRGMFHNAHEYDTLYAEGVGQPARYCAPRRDEGYEVEAVRRGIAQRAGLLRAADRPRAGELRGYIDLVSETCVAGWAQNTDHPEAPVCLDIYADGRLIGQVLANRYRKDLEAAGLGSGRHSFEFTPPLGITVGTIEVRRSLDAAALLITAKAKRARLFAVA